MEILELHILTDSQVPDIQALMEELEPGVTVPAERIVSVVEAPGTHFFAAVEESGRIVGCATLCVYDIPTGRKAWVEDVVVHSSCRGQHLGKRLMEHIIDFARRKMGEIALHLTSRPQRVAANQLYRSLGFQQRETNVYKLGIRTQPDAATTSKLS